MRDRIDLWDALEFAGAILVTLGVGLLLVPLGVIAAGGFCLYFGGWRRP